MIVRRLTLAVAAALVLATPLWAQRAEPKPDELEPVKVTAQFGAQIPLDLEFTDSSGKTIKLAEVFDGTRPVILTMNYANCPMLCSLQLEGLLSAMENMRWTAGEEYRIVTISIDPLETPERSQLVKQKYLNAYGRAKDPSAWRFLVSRDEEKIRRVADTVGFGYAYSPDTKEYLHAATLILCTPDGRVARYLNGVQYNPETLRLSLYESGEGEVGGPWDEVLLFCYQYDGRSGSYGMAAMRLMQTGGALTIVVMGTMLWVFWRREPSRPAPAPVEGTK
jgi:protein SCO1/2